MLLFSRRAVLAAGAVVPFAAWAAPAPGSYGTIRRSSAGLDALIAPGRERRTDRLRHPMGRRPGVGEGRQLSAVQRSAAEHDVPLGAGPARHVFMTSLRLCRQPIRPLREAGSNGLAIDASGALVMCDSGTRALARHGSENQDKKVFVDKFEGKRFNSPNDLCIARSGAIYFTDPPYGLAGLENSPVKELPFSGVYRWTPDGKVVLLEKSFLYPNGVALSPDESILYVSNTDDKTCRSSEPIALAPTACRKAHRPSSTCRR